MFSSYSENRLNYFGCPIDYAFLDVNNSDTVRSTGKHRCLRSAATSKAVTVDIATRPSLSRANGYVPINRVDRVDRRVSETASKHAPPQVITRSARRCINVSRDGSW